MDPDAQFREWMEEQTEEIRKAKAMISYYKDMIKYHRAMRRYYIRSRKYEQLLERRLDRITQGLQVGDG